KVEISLQPAEIGEAAPGARFGVVDQIVVSADLVVAADRAAQEKRRWKQVAQLGAVGLRFAADRSLQRQRRIDERILMLMELGQAAEVSKKPAASGLQVPWQRGRDDRRLLDVDAIVAAAKERV